MAKNYYVRFFDEPLSVKVSSEDFRKVLIYGDYYDSLISIVSHRYGSTAYVGFSSFFFHTLL